MEPRLSTEEAKAVIATKTAPRVTEEHIKAKMRSVCYERPFAEHPQLTLCAITMDNGFVVIGKSAPASPENFDQEVGRRYAFDDAFKQLWQFEGYLLREKLQEQGACGGPSSVA
jgi:hypothetical protein